jgi:hypothetical protein
LAKETAELSFSQKGEPPVRSENAKNDIQNILSWFSEAFSSPSFKFFCAYVIGFIQLGKEAHTSSTVQSLIQSTWERSLSSFTRFLADYIWDHEKLVRTAVDRFFYTLKIKPGSVLFLLVDDTLAQKTGKKIPGADGIKIMPITWPMSLAINGSFRLCFIRTSSFPFGPTSTIRKGPKDVDGFKPKWRGSKRSWENFNSPYPVRFIFWPMPGIGLKTWLKFAVNRGVI